MAYDKRSAPPNSPQPPQARPPEPRWSGRLSIGVFTGLGALLWGLVAVAAWLLARMLG